MLVASSIDEFQFADASSAGLVPVPNSDAAFAEGYAEGKALMSKSVNSDMYSASMKEKAQSTTPWIESMSAIESFVAGQKIADVKAKARTRFRAPRSSIPPATSTPPLRLLRRRRRAFRLSYLSPSEPVVFQPARFVA